MVYIDKDNVKQRPIMIHRAIFGSLERFFGILIENFAGAPVFGGGGRAGVGQKLCLHI